jgi:tRNA G18 (ribose-2'-O)-methylase SpoU
MSNSQELILIVHNIRSSHNVGSMLRTGDGLGIAKIYLTGYTPYPLSDNDARLPYLAMRIDKQIHKTALGAEQSILWEYHDSILPLISKLRGQEFKIYALEQVTGAIPLTNFKPPKKLAIIVGREVEGIEPEIIDAVDSCLEIPMKGTKESFNVAVAAAMTLFYCQNLPK